MPGRIRQQCSRCDPIVSYLVGAGLSAAFINVLDPEIMRAVYLIKSFRDEITFAAGEIL